MLLIFSSGRIVVTGARTYVDVKQGFDSVKHNIETFFKFDADNSSTPQQQCLHISDTRADTP